MVRRVRYDSAFTFQYSKRSGTPAAAMENQVPHEEVQRHFDQLLAEVQEIARESPADVTSTRFRRCWWKELTSMMPLWSAAV